MNFVLFYHSVISDWNNGNAHFLRGVVRQLANQGHHVVVYEPRDAWSVTNLESTTGQAAEEAFTDLYPEINYVRYQPALLQLDEVLEQADVVIVHEWNPHDLVAQIGRHHFRHDGYTLLFHDTHHRSVTDPEAMSGYDLRHYDGVLAFGAVVKDLYLENGWAARAYTWHEAADISLFYPRQPEPGQRDVLWIGNWGDEERTQELHDYFFAPAREVGLRSAAYGVRYPAEALPVLERAGISYHGWLPNYRVPEVAAGFRAMVHVPRRPYVEALPGIPTIRPFEALACGIPLVSAWWDDAEQLFRPGTDYLVARTPEEMKRHLQDVLNDRELAASLVHHGLETVQQNHTCGHRVKQLLQILEEIRGEKSAERVTECQIAKL